MIIESVAGVTGTDPTRLEPLYHVVDPDALDALFAPTSDPDARVEGSVTIQYNGHTVTVKADDQILVDGKEVKSPSR